MKIICSVLVVFFFNNLYSQTEQDVYDTAKRLDPLSASYDEFTRNRSFNHPKDSSMVYLQQYDMQKAKVIGMQNLGDVSTPWINLQFNPEMKTGFSADMTPFSNLYFMADSARFYQALLPYTEFYYAQGKGGQRGMIDFDAFHTQNFGKRFNLTALYHSASNDGFYSRQSLSNKNIQLSLYYISKNNRYSAAGVATWNKVNKMENGGIDQDPSNDTLFKSIQNPSARLVDVSLNQARNINRYREHKLTQVYWLLMQKSNDSSAAQGQLGISHTFTALRQSNFYTDASSDYGFYDSVYYFNPLNSSDSFVVQQSSNQIEIFTPVRARGLSFKAGLRYDYIQTLQWANAGNYSRGIYHNTSFYGQVHFILRKTFNSQVKGLIYPEGYNAGDYQLQWINQTTIDKKKKWSVGADVMSSFISPAYRQTQFFSNHYRWKNQFEKTAIQALGFTLSRKIRRPQAYNAYFYSLPAQAFQIKAKYSLIDNYIYYGLSNKPEQTGKGLSVFQTAVHFHLNLKSFQWHQEMVYQVFSEALKSQIQLPEFISKSSLYFQSYAFKKASFIQIGIDAYISSAYKAGLYNPGLQNFRVSQTEVGAYPFLDFFINAEVKTARIFFKMEHFNQDLLGTDYFRNYIYVSPYQPSAPRRFRLGFVWKFYY